MNENFVFIRNFLTPICMMVLERKRSFRSEEAQISVQVDAEAGVLMVKNSGASHFIDVEMDPTHNMYIPEMILTQMLSGSNFADEQDGFVGGQNGLGAKLAIIFSSDARIDVRDPSRQVKYTQMVSKNMKEVQPPRIKESRKQGGGYVSVLVKPELHRFEMESLAEPAFVAWIQRRCLELASFLPNATVTLNGEPIDGTGGFGAFARVFMDSHASERPSATFTHASEHWRVCAWVTPPDAEPILVSYVNGIQTARGGKHVDHCLDALVMKLRLVMKTSDSQKPASRQQVRNLVSMVVECNIAKPKFDSQTKDSLQTEPKLFGSEFTPSEAEVNKLLKGKDGLIARVKAAAVKHGESVALKAQQSTARKSYLSIPKLEDAIDAGTKNNAGTILQITEGESAKTVAMRGIQEMGSKKWGAFPIRGKLLNAYHHTIPKILANAEMKALLQILGLKLDMKIETQADVRKLRWVGSAPPDPPPPRERLFHTPRALDDHNEAEPHYRYSKLLILTDADTDGSHIAGLVLVFFERFWPYLIECNFCSILLTPVVKAMPLTASAKRLGARSFYDLNTYNEWKKDINDAHWKIRYYKGLGTSTAEEAKGYFREVKNTLKPFEWDTDAHLSLEKAFADTQRNEQLKSLRKQWMNEYTPAPLDVSLKTFSITYFVDLRVREYCVYSLFRHIPGFDGLKDVQRKIVWAVLTWKDRWKEKKVVQMSGA